MSRSIAAAALKALTLALTGIALSAGSAGAQVRQYTPPGGRVGGVEDRKAAIEQAVSEARWHLGSVRVDPAFWISDISWVDNPGEGVDSDFSARIGAGLRAFLPVGSKTTFIAYAMPEYIWWNERADERRLNQRFGLGSFTYFNRLLVELSAERNEDFGYATAETFQRLTMRTDLVKAELEVPVFHSITIHALGARSSFESLAEGEVLDAVFSDLNRDDTVWRGGLRYYPIGKLYLGGGVGHSESAFADEAEDRSNSGDYWYVETGYARPKLDVTFDYQENDLEAEDGSSFGAFSGSTGGARIEWRPRETISARVYGHRSLGYSLAPSPDAPSGYLEQTAGVGLRTKIGWRLELDLYTESGSLDYDEELGGSGRSDDLETYGASLSATFAERMLVGIAYRHSTISAGGLLPDRELEEIRGTLSFGLGGGAGTWY